MIKKTRNLQAFKVFLITKIPKTTYMYKMHMGFSIISNTNDQIFSNIDVS